MDFVLSEEQQSIFDMAHDFAEQMIAPHAVNWDQTEQMPKDVLRGRRAAILCAAPPVLCSLGYSV